MRRITFSMDDAKDEANQRKHGITFQEARTVFFDEDAIRFFDVDHSEDEDRYLMLGVSAYFRVLVVSHCYRKEGLDVRIISARKATKNEKATYRRSKR